ncbi:hypothetical protein POSPLADRAFT_1036849 [Postia placenta MAD-698-R-SB12]|uniref:Uncharacterized protein n=1 Tax=Postia placenta MAD-698-R-SB12 TaxID=670580 RepID=A0A1X6MLR5_9APHY|nr:hypothetical protein POSPLADRAFT_1036849 [Postia placenta MAD-698-R-SB12]OSX57344.1 hypothetical protein POSPLADRAFT_1036849 [Postia placenta MAD-698-R-SB12]
MPEGRHINETRRITEEHLPVASPQDKQTNTEEDLKARRQDEDSRLEPGEGFAAQDRGKRETNCTHRAGVVAVTGAVHGAHKSISDGREASQRDQRTKADGRRPRRRAKGARPGKERTADWLRGRKEEQRACTGEGDRKERERLPSIVKSDPPLPIAVCLSPPISSGGRKAALTGHSCAARPLPARRLSIAWWRWGAFRCGARIVHASQRLKKAAG